MADNKSREGIKPAQYETHGIKGPPKTKRPPKPPSQHVGESKVKLNVDVSDALKGLKAVQREAKKATAALKELEGQRNKTSMFHRTPFAGHPNTVPDHVKNYGKSEGYSKKGKSSGGVWFGDENEKN